MAILDLFGSHLCLKFISRQLYYFNDAIRPLIFITLWMEMLWGMAVLLCPPPQPILLGWIFSQPLWMLCRCFSFNKLKQGLVCYICLERSSYRGINIPIVHVYNELGHRNMKHFEYFFSQNSGININHLTTVIEGHEQALCCHAHIYLLNRTFQNQIIINRIRRWCLK